MKFKLLDCKIGTNKNLLLNKEPISNLITTFDDLKKYIKSLPIEGNASKVLYSNMENFHKILYKYDEIIDISSLKIRNLSDLFYLSLIIMDNLDCINYSYNIDYIISLNKLNDICKCMNIRNILFSKTILEIINNYKELDENEENFNVQSLDEIEKQNSEIIKNKLQYLNAIGLEYKVDDIEIKKIDEIYKDIIIGLIKSNKIDDYNFACNIIKELDLESIDITQTIINGLNEILNKNNNIMKEIQISNIKDFSNEKKINFYYFILKYVIKNSFYVYQIPFLLKTKKLILKLLKSNENIKINIRNNKEQLFWIIKFLLDSDYYLERLNNINDNLEPEFSAICEVENKGEENKRLEDFYFYRIPTEKKNSLNNKKTIGTKETEINKKADLEKILEYIAIIGKHISYNVIIKESYNGQYIAKADNKFYIYNSYFKLIRTIEIIDCNNINSKLNELFENIPNLTSSNSEKENDTPLIQKKKKKFKIDFNAEYNGIDHDKNKYMDIYKLTKNIFIIKSYSLFPNSEDKLIFYDRNEKKELKKIEGYSFNKSPHGILKMKLKGLNNEKILLCACKKYNSQVNGILLINPKIKENKEIKNPFYNTDYFEVNCFCQILKIDNKNDDYEDIDYEYRKNIDIEYTDYFFAGGFDVEKRVGIIKLFKLTYKEEINNTIIEYIQDIEFEEKKEFDGFDEAINSIIQTKLSGNIVVSTNDGNIYLFTPPNIDYYSNETTKSLV